MKELILHEGKQTPKYVVVEEVDDRATTWKLNPQEIKLPALPDPVRALPDFEVCLLPSNMVFSTAYVAHTSPQAQ